MGLRVMGSWRKRIATVNDAHCLRLGPFRVLTSWRGCPVTERERLAHTYVAVATAFVVGIIQ